MCSGAEKTEQKLTFRHLGPTTGLGQPDPAGGERGACLEPD